MHPITHAAVGCSSFPTAPPLSKAALMELTGKITQILAEKTGSSARGPWRKQEYIIETQGQYPKPVCFMLWGDKIDECRIQVGQELIVSVNLESRENNGRWYTDVKAWKVAATGAAAADNAAPEYTGPPVYDEGQAEDDIPF